MKIYRGKNAFSSLYHSHKKWEKDLYGIDFISTIQLTNEMYDLHNGRGMSGNGSYAVDMLIKKLKIHKVRLVGKILLK